MTSLKTIHLAVFDDREPFVRTVRWRTVAKTPLSDSTVADDPSVRRGSRRTPATSRDPSSGSHRRCTSRAVFLANTSIAFRRLSVSARRKFRSNPSSCWPVPRAAPCSGGWRSCAASSVGAWCRERLRRAPSRSQARHRRRQYRGRDLQVTSLHVGQQLAPALRNLANAGLETEEFLFALGRGTDQSRVITGGERFGASLPTGALSAS